ncbi:39S ribosomal protein L44, mitochondrial-like [Paramacrobiotus metropolitanus]|uniref:39S ribosomal protein L44, mitochondrial-like n=1 Tax=Paramacrobiotus metropolitanus TaxID=2943436 RepID=UPI00244565AF|nr:39S ribosomal protein L44, mitochondrial-like [Paramacrobiotus metropolitanus]
MLSSKTFVAKVLSMRRTERLIQQFLRTAYERQACPVPMSTETIRRHLNTTAHLHGTGFTKSHSKAAHQLYKYRLKAGPEPLRHRSIWQNWNYDAEIYAFGQRLGENFSTETLRLAFMHPSYQEQEMAKRRELMIDEQIQIGSIAHHTALKDAGMELMHSYIPSFLRYNYPFFPEEGIKGLTNFLCSDDVLAEISFFLGTSDLIMCADFPPERSTLVDTLYAIVGALAKDSGVERAEYFVLDFVITHLADKDVNEHLPITNPMGVIADILEREGKAEPESRLLRKTGESTLMAAYLVGVYSDKKLIGESFGETLLIAEEMAARDALIRMFKTDLKQRPLLWGQAGRNLPLQHFYNVPNVSLSDWSTASCGENFQRRISSEAAKAGKQKKQVVQ